MHTRKEHEDGLLPHIRVVGTCDGHELDWRHKLHHHRFTVDQDGKTEYDDISGQIGSLLEVRVQNSALARHNLAGMLRGLADFVEAEYEFDTD